MSGREPSNRTIASLLKQHAQLLQLAGESSFRSRAFVRAAEAIGQQPESVPDLLRAGRVRLIPGIGEGIASAIANIVDTGTFPEHVELTDAYPESLLELLELPGVGSKTARLLFDQYEIDSVDALEDALGGDTIDNMPSLSARTRANLIAGIQEFRRRSGLVPLSRARPLALDLVHAIQRARPSDKVEMAGAIRRWDVSVTEIDLVVGTDAPKAVFNAINAAGILHDSDFDSATGLICGASDVETPVRIFTTRLEDMGSALVRATGSASHLARLGVVPAGLATEEAVYASFDLPWIPPELRQGHLEFERTTEIPTLVTIADIRGQLHAHTRWSDGADEISDLARAAAARGFEYLAITDHSHGLGVAGGLDQDRLKLQWAEIDATPEVDGVRLLKGAEVEVLRDGSLDYSDATLSQLDVAVASIHSGLRLSQAELTSRLLSVLRLPHVDIIAHPSGRQIGRREGGDFDWPLVFAAAAESGTALEISADPSRLDLDPALALAASTAGCRFTINCDAHSASGFDNLPYGVAMARRAWLKPDQIINCMHPDELLAWLEARGN